jgi:hypothetical protein
VGTGAVNRIETWATPTMEMTVTVPVPAAAGILIPEIAVIAPIAVHKRAISAVIETVIIKGCD